VGRVTVVSVMIYQIGYQRGITHFAQDPERVEVELVKFSLGLEEDEDIGQHVHSSDTVLYRRVSGVSDRVVLGAKRYCESKVAETKGAIEQLSRLYPSQEDLVVAHKVRVLELREEERRWMQACRRLHGKWSLVLSRRHEINAFVSGCCPRKIFVFEGLLKKLDLNDDEIAMIIGHELSHVILGHVDEEVPLSVVLLVTQLVLMAFVDPTGIWSYLFDSAVASFRDLITAKYSQTHENEADALGLLIAGLACFDINKGVEVYHKLASLTPDHKQTGWFDTHPASAERHEHVRLLSRYVESKNPHGSHCAHQGSILRALGLVK